MHGCHANFHGRIVVAFAGSSHQRRATRVAVAGVEAVEQCGQFHAAAGTAAASGWERVQVLFLDA